jgi:hypothetical protein
MSIQVDIKDVRVDEKDGPDSLHDASSSTAILKSRMTLGIAHVCRVGEFDVERRNSVMQQFDKLLTTFVRVCMRQKKKLNEQDGHDGFANQKALEELIAGYFSLLHPRPEYLSLLISQEMWCHDTDLQWLKGLQKRDSAVYRGDTCLFIRILHRQSRFAEDTLLMLLKPRSNAAPMVPLHEQSGCLKKLVECHADGHTDEFNKVCVPRQPESQTSVLDDTHTLFRDDRMTHGLVLRKTHVPGDERRVVATSRIQLAEFTPADSTAITRTSTVLSHEKIRCPFFAGWGQNIIPGYFESTLKRPLVLWGQADYVDRQSPVLCVLITCFTQYGEISGGDMDCTQASFKEPVALVYIDDGCSPGSQSRAHIEDDYRLGRLALVPTRQLRLCGDTRKFSSAEMVRSNGQSFLTDMMVAVQMNFRAWMGPHAVSSSKTSMLSALIVSKPELRPVFFGELDVCHLREIHFDLRSIHDKFFLHSRTM